MSVFSFQFSVFSFQFSALSTVLLPTPHSPLLTPLLSTLHSPLPTILLFGAACLGHTCIAVWSHNWWYGVNIPRSVSKVVACFTIWS